MERGGSALAFRSLLFASLGTKNIFHRPCRTETMTQRVINNAAGVRKARRLYRLIPRPLSCRFASCSAHEVLLEPFWEIPNKYPKNTEQSTG